MNNLLRYYSGKKVLVIGGTGFIGYNLIQKLSSLGVHVDTIYTKKNIRVDSENIYFVRIEHYSKVSHILKKNFDVIFNCAGQSNRLARLSTFRKPAKTNIMGVVNIIDAIRLYSPNSKLVMIGSRQEYGRSRYLPVDENHPVEPRDPYSVEKLATTMYAQTSHAIYNVKSVVLRLSNVYGRLLSFQAGNHNIVSQCIRRALQRKPLVIFGDGNQIRDYLYIDDLLEALLLVGIEPKTSGQIYNVGYGKGIAFKEMMEIITQFTGVPIIHKNWPKDYALIETGDYYTDITKLTHTIPWSPRYSYIQGIRKTIQLYKEKNDRYA